MNSSYIRTVILIWQVSSPAKVILSGVGVLLLVRFLFHLFAQATYNLHVPQAAKNVLSSQETPSDIFRRIENSFHRLEVYLPRHYQGV